MLLFSGSKIYPNFFVGDRNKVTKEQISNAAEIANKIYLGAEAKPREFSKKENHLVVSQCFINDESFFDLDKAAFEQALNNQIKGCS